MNAIHRTDFTFVVLWGGPRTKRRPLLYMYSKTTPEPRLDYYACTAGASTCTGANLHMYMHTGLGTVSVRVAMAMAMALARARPAAIQ